MDLHPLVVHFPVALLTIYALAECVRPFRLMTQPAWQLVKAALVSIGAAFSFFALATGEVAEELRGESELIEVHSAWATATTWIFGCIALVYIFGIIAAYRPQWFSSIGVLAKAGEYARRCARHWGIVCLAIIGLIGLTITGALGAALVHGPAIDPVVSAIYTITMGKPNEVVPPVEQSREKTFTAAEVALHATEKSCYSIIRTEVYDLTTAIATHPGGADKILRICGKDGTAAFMRKHGGGPQEESIKELRIGVLAE